MATFQLARGVPATSKSIAPARSVASVPRNARMMAQQQTKADFSSDFAEITQALEALGAKLGSATASPPAPKPELDESTGYYCDENGCVLLSGPGVAPDGSRAGLDFSVDEELSGKGWLLGLSGVEVDAQYCGVVGGAEFSVSLTLAELKDFVKALHAIRDAMKKLAAGEGSSDEEGAPAIKVKWAEKTVSMEAMCTTSSQANADNFRLSFSVGVGGLRLVRGSWSPSVVADVMRTLDKKVAGFSIARS